MTNAELRERIDACRLDTRDLAEPEMVPLAEQLKQDEQVRIVLARSVRFDAVLSEAFHDVPVPMGLEERLLARLRAVASAIEDCTANAPQSNDPVPTNTPLVSPAAVAVDDDQDSRRVAVAPRPVQSQAATRKRSIPWKTLAGFTAISAAIVMAVVLAWPGHQPFHLDEALPATVVGWNEQVANITWNENVAEATSRERPLDPGLRVTPWRWAVVATQFDRQTVVFDLTPPRQAAVVVYCFAGEATDLPKLPPAAPFSTTHGLAIGVWQSRGLVYVLAVQGDRQRYERVQRTLIHSGGNFA